MREARDTITAKNQEHYLWLLRELDSMGHLERRESPTWYMVELAGCLTNDQHFTLRDNEYVIVRHFWGPT